MKTAIITVLGVVAVVGSLALIPTSINVAPENVIKPIICVRYQTWYTSGSSNVKLIGEEAEGTSTAVEVKAGKGLAFRFQAEYTGNLTGLNVRVVSFTGTILKVGLFSDNTGIPGTVLVEDAVPASYKLEAGKYYWLGVLPVGGPMLVRDHGASGPIKDAESSNVVTELNKAAWFAPVSFGPMAIWGNGTESIKHYGCEYLKQFYSEGKILHAP